MSARQAFHARIVGANPKAHTLELAFDAGAFPREITADGERVTIFPKEALGAQNALVQALNTSRLVIHAAHSVRFDECRDSVCREIRAALEKVGVRHG